jgi:hypothetical protein
MKLMLWCGRTGYPSLNLCKIDLIETCERKFNYFFSPVNFWSREGHNLGFELKNVIILADNVDQGLDEHWLAVSSCKKGKLQL